MEWNASQLCDDLETIFILIWMTLDIKKRRELCKLKLKMQFDTTCRTVPELWNSIPNDIKHAGTCTIEKFKTSLKTYLFKK